MTKHLYQRTITKNGKKIKAWYYWYYDSEGKQVRKSCGQNGKPCLLKRDAQTYIENLPEEDISEYITFNQFCNGFYEPDSRFIRKQKSRLVEYQPQTIYQKKLYLNKFLERFGEFRADKITASDIENWLVDLNYCNSVRNNILGVINDIENELYSYHYIPSVLHIRHYKRNTKSKGTLSLSEIKFLFPDDYYELIEKWTILKTDREVDIYSFATMIYTIVSTGMRSCEIRALQWNQFVREDAILINAMIDSNDERVNRLKKWTDDNKKWRLTILPDKTKSMIQKLKLLQTDNNEYVFTRKDEEITDDFLLSHLKCVLRKNGIDHTGRNITTHSLRFTYNTLMRKEISGDDLRMMMGHASEEMTDYYDKSTVLEHLPELLNNKDSINSIFN